MSVRSSEPARRLARRLAQAQARRTRGFTLVELIAVTLLVGVMAVVAMPRIDGALVLRNAAWRDQIKAGLLHARALAQGHRRLVCMTLATGEIRLNLASANPASSCGTVITGANGDARWAFDSNGTALGQAPAGTLYFQPDGRITSDGAGSSAINVSITLAGETNLQLTGETGHVQ